VRWLYVNRAAGNIARFEDRAGFGLMAVLMKSVTRRAGIHAILSIVRWRQRRREIVRRLSRLSQGIASLKCSAFVGKKRVPFPVLASSDYEKTLVCLFFSPAVSAGSEVASMNA